MNSQSLGGLGQFDLASAFISSAFCFHSLHSLYCSPASSSAWCLLDVLVLQLTESPTAAVNEGVVIPTQPGKLLCWLRKSGWLLPCWQGRSSLVRNCSLFNVRLLILFLVGEQSGYLFSILWWHFYP